MFEIFAERLRELSRHAASLAERLPTAPDPATRRSIEQAQRETRGRVSVYAPVLAGITSRDAAREYLEKVSAEAARLLRDMQQSGETINETEAAAPIVSGFYHETRYALALLRCAADDITR